MLFDGLIQKKLSSLLQPWLVQEPDWEVKLGFLRSLVVVRNLNFDVTALNRLIGGNGEVRFSFKKVTVDEISFRLAYWSTPAFTLHVHGVHVTLFPEKQAEGGVWERVEVSVDDYLEERKKKIIARIDADGSMLHDNIEKIMTATSKTGLMNSLTNLVLMHCCLHLHDVCLRVEFPVSDDNCAWLCYMRELNAESSNKKLACFFGRFMGILFLPFRESCFDLEAHGLEIGAEGKSHSSCIFSCVNPYIGIRMKDLDLVNFVLSVPEMNFSFSPGQFQMMGAFSNLLFIESKHIRSGRLLWQIARSKIHNILLPPGHLFHKMVLVAVLWLRLVREYHYILELVGCFGDGMEVSIGRKFSRPAKQNWRLISEIERDLPAEAIASARRVARYRAAMKDPHAEDIAESPRSSCVQSFWRIMFPLVVIWGVLLKILAAILSIFFARKDSTKILLGHPGMMPEASDSRCSFHLSFGKISAVICSIDDGPPKIRKISNLRSKDFCRDVSSFCLLVKGLLFIHEEGILEQHMSFSVGFIEGTSIPNSGGMEHQNISGKVDDIRKGSLNERLEDPETIVWGEPALMSPDSEDGGSRSAAIPFLEQMSGDIELIQEQLHFRFQGMKTHYEGKPWAVCDIRTFWVYPGLKSPDYGLSKCCFMVGKLTFALDYSSVLSIATLIGQVQHAFYQLDCSIVASDPSRTSQGSQKTKMSDSLKSHVNEVTMRLFHLLPDKHVELRAVVAGPRVQISLGHDEILSSDKKAVNGSRGVSLTINVHDSNFAVWPTENSGVASCGGHQRPNDLESEFFKLQERVISRFSEMDNVNYASKGQISLCYYIRLGGLNAYFEDSVESCIMQFLLLKPVTAKFTMLRDYLHSFGRSLIASSLSLCGAMTGVTGLFYMDELSVILQVFQTLFSAASINASGRGSSSTAQIRQVSVEHQRLWTEPANKETIIGTSEGVALNSETLFSVSTSFELGQFDIILQNSRDGTAKGGFSVILDANNIGKFGLEKFPDSGIWLSVQKTCIDIAVGDVNAEIDARLSGFHTVIFISNNQRGNAVRSDVDNTVLQSIDCLQEISLSTFTCTVILDCKVDSDTLSDSATSSSNPNNLLSDPSLRIDDEGLNPKSAQDKHLVSDASNSAPNSWLLVNIAIDVIFIGTCLIKNGVHGAHPLNKLYLSLSIGGDFQSVCLWSQGGLIFVETTALARFVHCLNSYLHCIRTLLYGEYLLGKSTEVTERGAVTYVQEPTHGDGENQLAYLVRWELWEDVSVKVSQFSLVLLATDEFGLVKEIIGKVDLSVKLWLENRRKFLFNLSYLEILSQSLNVGVGQTEKNAQMPHFSSVGSSYESLWLDTEYSAAEGLQGENSVVFSKDKSHSSTHSSMASTFADDTASPVSGASETDGNYILQQLSVTISAEKPFSEIEHGQDFISQGWVGSGSLAGLNVTISLLEIQMLLAAIESLSEVSSKDAASDLKERNWLSINKEPEKDLEAAFPDGAVVAIQDVHQHMYVTVESVENKFRLVGVVHYSVAGKRALFRVKRQKKRWNFSASWFSLLSLHAKSGSGEPLRLNYCASSGFVDISSNTDSACALWKIASCKSESYEDDVDLEPLNHLSNNAFYLLNKKNDLGVAFIDDALEFVKKPGNPFKFKVFHHLPWIRDLVMSESHQLVAPELALLDTQITSEHAGNVPCITMAIEKISLTIVHKVSDAKDQIPLLQGCINSTDVIIQVLLHKTRVMSAITAMLYHFDVQGLLWRELVQPIEICLYYRSRSVARPQDTKANGMHSCLYIRMKEFELSLTELSLDILLYVVGKLDFAGPFAVKSSAISANCCKVENQSELNLFCQFFDAQSARVGRKQSASIFLRHLVDQPLEASYATFKLESPEMSSTSSIHVPLSETRIFAWRTRIMSPRDSRTSPGPLVVFDISKNAEEGLSVVVSPLLRICNETGFPVELRIQRPEQIEAESASVLLREGETVDDCMAAFDAFNLSGGPKKALLSLGVGNFIFSFRPEMKSDESNSGRSYSVEWSDNLKGGKAVRLSGIIDKLSYQVRKAFSAESWKYSFSTASCSVGCENDHVVKMHFLVQIIGRDVPIIQPNSHHKSKNPSIALQEQKEVYLLPTIRVSNLLESDIEVLLSETEIPFGNGLQNINQANISCGLTVDLYSNPAMIYFNIKLIMFGSSCKPVNCEQWLKKLNKKKDGIQFLDIDLEFCDGKYFACLRLARGDRGILEAIVFTQYTLKNDTEFPLFCAAPNMKPSSRDETERHAIHTPPHLGSFLPPKTVRSWFMRSSKLRMKLLDEETSESILDLDALSGLAEISFTRTKGSRFRHMVKLGVSLGPLTSKIPVPSRVVSIVPRYVISNESDEQISVRQCFLEDGSDGTVSINSKEKAVLIPRIASTDKQDMTVFDKILRKHRISDDDASIYVQFRPKQTGLGWSGPVCVASLGRFFLKFKRSIDSPVHQSDSVTREDETTAELAAVHVVEEASTFVLYFYKPPSINLPYRIENQLSDASVTYYQKDTFEPETLASRSSVNYVWDDLTRPRKLMVKINGVNILREINLDKLRPWKPYFRVRQERELASHLPLDNRITNQRRTGPVITNGPDVSVGYEVYADGPTRVLRICDSAGRCKGDSIVHSCKKIQLRISYFSLHLLEHCKKEKKDADAHDLSTHTPIIVGRLENISLDSIFIDQRKYNQIRVQSMNVDEKWAGAPFAAMLRRNLTSSSIPDNCILFVVFVIYPTSSNVQEVKYSSIVLQPVDLNLDEETLMKIVPFWRTSLSSSTESRRYYFDHFEIHPVKIIASFLPDHSYSSYSTGQEAIRSLLHSVIKIPAIKNVVVELNGVSVTHALVTTRELVMKCAQHYSWYAMRAIYIAKGSPLLPPTFASIFDDLASSSLDVFFDPSSSLFNVQGLTLGTFKLVRKCIESKGFSGTKRYFGDLSKTLRNAGSNILFAAVTEISDSVLKGAESSGLNGMVTGFHHGILKLAMEPSLLGTAFMEGGPDRKIMLDRSPGVDELYIEGYLQAMLDTIYKQEYLRVRVIDNQVILKNLPPNSSLIGEIMDRVKEFLVSKALLKGDLSTSSRPLRHLRGDNEWRFGPTVLTLCEHLFVSFAIRMLRKQTDIVVTKFKLNEKWVRKDKESRPSSSTGATAEEPKGKHVRRWGIGRFILSAMVAYVDGRLCRFIPNPVARRIVSGFLLSFLDNRDSS